MLRFLGAVYQGSCYSFVMSNHQKRILILGGGTAGWMAANLMVRAWGQRGFDITLVESPDIATIGVGEGTWPTMRETLEKIGIDYAQGYWIEKPRPIAEVFQSRQDAERSALRLVSSE